MSTPNPQSPILNPVVPTHMGIILDGNRRWAKEQGLKTLEGHRRGSEVFKDISLELFDRGIKYVTGYIFSTENWNRTSEEVGYLMSLVIKALELHLDEYNKKGIRIQIIGARDKLQSSVLKAIERTEKKTENNKNGTLGLCFNYGGREEIVHAVKGIVSNGVQAEDITQELISKYMYASNIPDVDLMVRTSSEKRLSGFMLWRIWYAELAFIDTYWPAVTIEDFAIVLDDYAKRQRRFGC